MRIVRLANYVAPHSGGLRTSLRELGAGYLAAGHEPMLIIPGERDGDEQTAQGRVITLSGPRIPFTGGYRALLRKQRVAALLSELRPDTLEVSDRTTLRWTGRWARGPYETFGQTLQEAAASGLPVVAPAAGGPLDLVEDGVTGYLVPPGDADAFPAAVARLAADPATRAAFGAAGRRKVLSRSWPALTDELIDHYAAVLGRKRPAKVAV